MTSDSGGFAHDVFLSHSPEDKAVVCELAARLHSAGLKVWFDEWAPKSGESSPTKVEEVLENLRVLVLCTLAIAIYWDWAQFQPSTYRFLEPLSKDCHCRFYLSTTLTRDRFTQH